MERSFSCLLSRFVQKFTAKLLLQFTELLCLYCSPNVICVIESLVGACGMQAGKRKMCIRFWKGNLKERNRLEDLRVDDEKNIQIGFKETGFEDVEWIGLAQDRDKRWALVNAVTNGVAGNFSKA